MKHVLEALNLTVSPAPVGDPHQGRIKSSISGQGDLDLQFTDSNRSVHTYFRYFDVLGIGVWELQCIGCQDRLMYCLLLYQCVTCGYDNGAKRPSLKIVIKLSPKLPLNSRSYRRRHHNRPYRPYSVPPWKPLGCVTCM